MSNEPNIRNRVAGAVVLVSLAVILLPLILDGKKKNQIIDSYIPDKPKSGEIILVNVEDSLKRNEIDATAGQSEEQESITIDAKEIVTDSGETQQETEKQSPQPEQTKPEVVKSQPTKVVENKPEPKRQNRPNYDQAGFLVQLGGFSSMENAANLVAKMNAGGFRAYSKRGKAGGKTIYRVFAGPYLQKTKAEADMQAMKKLAAVNPIVVSYDPIKHARG